MTLKCGIVGLPNVGKSTLFNALTSSIAAEAANYPFCTIDPNFGCVSVPDKRLEKLAELGGSQNTIYAQIEFVDIAGLVRGAHEGQGRGNQFLSHIREVDCILYILRCFDDQDVIHVEGRVDPISDNEIIETELILADIQSLAKRIPNMEKKAKQSKEIADQLILINEVLKVLNEGKPARSLITEHNINEINNLQLLTNKPFLYVCNVAESDIIDGNALTDAVLQRANEVGAKTVLISAQIEQEIANLTEKSEKEAFLKALGLEESSLDRLIRASYETLDLITFFTIGPKEAHAWTTHKGSTAPQAAGVIHTDFEKGFICAETISCIDYINYGSEAKVKEAGKLRLEGREYRVNDGDIMHFRFNV
ncbi:MAG: redox-regulated ATPase YchF [Candidatus Midichloria sp.]|uniref:Obg-like ATPase 1 n=1 Tax=Hyalomma marginatum TaxID=34627 RepID=A0A8S4C4M1_9ACAR|nr:redox-regulated ATPase YchF [Hyalomma marginatum]CAG7592075.1 redox-regulated ATPase YchF [Hyalomma marginatum]